MIRTAVLALVLALWSSPNSRPPEDYVNPWRVTLIMDAGVRARAPHGQNTLPLCLVELEKVKLIITANAGQFMGERVYGAACVIDGMKT